MRPESSTVALRRDLTQVANEFDASAAALMFIGLSVLPVMRVGEESAKYPTITRESIKKAESDARGANGAYNRITGEFGEGIYACEEHGLEYRIDDKMRKRYASFIDAEQAATRILRYKHRLLHEKRVAAATLNATTVFTQNAPVTVWSTFATATPLVDLGAGMAALEDNTGMPRAMLSLIIPQTDKTEMLATTEVNDKIKYTYGGGNGGIQPWQISNAQIAAMLGIKQVLVAASSYDSKEEGYAETNTKIWTAGRVMLAYLAEGENAPLEMPQLGRTMLWTADAPAFPVMESYREDQTRGDILRIRDNTDEVLVAAANLASYVVTT